MMMQSDYPRTAWIDTGYFPRDGDDTIWGQTFKEMCDDGGIGANQWLNVDTGALLLLIASGGWKTGGQFHLFYTRPHDVVRDITGALGTMSDRPRFSPRFDQGDPGHWQTVKDSCTHAVRRGITQL